MIWLQLTVLVILVILIKFCLVSKGDNRLVIWPEYFDNSLSKNHGRRVPRKLATQSPTVDDIAKAAKKLKLNPKIERNKAYPNRWWRKSGRVLIKSKNKKSKVIRQLAIVIKKSKK